MIGASSNADKTRVTWVQREREINKDGFIVAYYSGTAAKSLGGIIGNSAPRLKESRLRVVMPVQRTVPADCRYHRQRQGHGYTPAPVLDRAQGNRHWKKKPCACQQEPLGFQDSSRHQDSQQYRKN